MKITEHEGNCYFAGWAGLQLFFRERHPETDPKASVVVLHGYTQHADWFMPVEDLLLDAGFSVFSFDMRGHGRSEGIRGDLVKFTDLARDIVTFTTYVREKSAGRKVFMVAHSLGASAAVSYAGRPWACIDGLVTSGLYVIDAEGYPKWKHVVGRAVAPFLPLLPIQELDPDRFAVDTAVCERYRNDPLIYHGGVRIRMGMHFMDMEAYLDGVPKRIEIPLLILHGKEDRLASVEGSRKLYEEASSSDKQLLEIDNCGHEVLNDYPWKDNFATILKWLNERA